MNNLSMKNVYDYDLNKYHMLMKNNRNRWSLFKREQRIVTEESEPNRENSQLSHNHRKDKNTTGKNSSNLSTINEKDFETAKEKYYPSSRKKS